MIKYFFSIILVVLIVSCKKDNSKIDSSIPSNNIVFTSDEAIYKVDINSKIQQVLFSSDTLWGFNEIKLSPNKERIVFSARFTNNTVRQIFIIKSDGTELKQLTHQNYDHFCPNWSSDGNQIVFVTNVYPESYLVVIDSDGNNEKILLKTASVFYPIWSPDGSKIAMQSQENIFFSTNIVVMKNDGSVIDKITENHFFLYNRNKMSWTADSKNIIFSTTRENTDQGNIGVVNISDKSITWLTSNENDGMVDLSPTGKIAFYSTRDGHAKIYTMDFDGKNQIPITTLSSTNPRWLSDGKRMVCKSWEGSDVMLYLINSDGTSQQQLSEKNYYATYLTSFDL